MESLFMAPLHEQDPDQLQARDSSSEVSPRERHVSPAQQPKRLVYGSHGAALPEPEPCAAVGA